jgi:hypothetical protein
LDPIDKRFSCHNFISYPETVFNLTRSIVHVSHAFWEIR